MTSAASFPEQQLWRGVAPIDRFFPSCLVRIRVQNPNYVPARLNGVVMAMFHENLEGKEAPFGVVTFSGKDTANLPARGSAIIQAQVGKSTA